MEKGNWRRQWRWLLWLSAMAGLVFLFLILDGGSDMKSTSVVRRALRSIGSRSSLDVRLQTNSLRQEVILDNGLVRLTFSKPGGDVIGINYNGIDNLLETDNKENNRGYWDIVWNKKPGDKTINIDTLQGTKYEVIKADKDGAEISFSRTWNVSLSGTTVPLNIEKRYIMLRNYPGFYTYSILERLNGWPEAEIGQVRIVYKLQQDKFRFMAISDNRQRIMPTMRDRLNGQPLAYPEAVLLTNPSDPELRGEVDDKYQYSCESKDNRLHGWISTSDPPTGFWIITPSTEFRSAGPVKQELTSHAGPIALSMFTSAHYAGRDAVMTFEEGEPWKKVFGPVSVYLNSISVNEDPLTLWENAKQKMQEEVEAWPYNFPQSKDHLISVQRGSVGGQLVIRDRYINRRLFWAGFAYVGLAAPGEVGSWQKESKGYQFWTQTDKRGYFSIKNVRPGNYSLYAWAPGIIGDYKYNEIITIEPKSKIELHVLIYEPPRNGPTLWEIGIPDRTAAEFYVPDPYPTLMNQLYSNHPDKFRQYGLWDRYADLFPNKDLIYTVGVSDYRSDWFFAQVNRNIGNETYQGTTWQIVFELENVIRPGNYTLQLALASASNMELQVRFNDRSSEPAFSTGLIGKDNAIARHGIHGLYWFYSINVPSTLLRHGNNVIYLTQARNTGPFEGLMYDYIRLEGPPRT
ncbi:Rhamnogalacturonate lyase [Parasponia andersonii]|uniref:rhamnogalacturonan endolyase n=1 Tax=Parasponia andersonii TaxID=3476 RepID=A0A2P5A767_PARAD|nr:Rhamnogalacturonate lyase [Parasponia andersonii]